MLERLLTDRRVLQRQRLQRERARPVRIAQAVFVVNGQRFHGLAQQAGRASGQVHELLPRDRRVAVLARAPAQQRVGA